MSNRATGLPSLKAFIRRLLWEHERIRQDVIRDEDDAAFQAEIGRIELAGGQFPVGRARQRHWRWHRAGRLNLLYHRARNEVERAGMPTFLPELEEAWRAHRAEMEAAIAHVEGVEDGSSPERFIRAAANLVDHYKAAVSAMRRTTGGKGKPGRRGYPLEALEYARALRAENPQMKAEAIRSKCLKKFSECDLPPDGDSFRRWLNRDRANRAN